MHKNRMVLHYIIISRVTFNPVNWDLQYLLLPGLRIFASLTDPGRQLLKNVILIDRASFYDLAGSYVYEYVAPRPVLI